MLLDTAEPLGRHYQALLVDLDGVVYRGRDAVPHAVGQLAGYADAGGRALFVTNNASRTPADVAEHLRELDVHCDSSDVVTSVQAAAAVLAELIRQGAIPDGATALVVGANALADAVAELGLRPVSTAAEQPAVVVQGFSPDIAWPLLAEAAYAIRAGAMWLATNSDATLPTEHGLAPGNGSLIAALATATGSHPTVAGKPERPLFDTALKLTGADPSTTMVVGDRLDSDILGANNADLPSLLVLTGVSTVRDLLNAPEDLRPSYVGFDLRVLEAAQSRVHVEAGRARCGGFVASADDQRMTLTGAGVPADGLRAAAAASWAVTSGEPDTDDVCALLESLRP